MYVCDLFNLIKTTKDYKTAGDSVDYKVLVDDENHRIKLLFQCSHGDVDWKNNFDFPVKPYKEQENTLYYHRGFAKAYKSANDAIMSDLISAVSKNQEYVVEISGWSLGGAMAVLAAEDFNFRTGRLSVLITFGSPKVCFGKKTKERIKNCCFLIRQFANVNDCVPDMPPFPGYCHVDEVKIGYDSWNLFRWLNPNKYHTAYGDLKQYEEQSK